MKKTWTEQEIFRLSGAYWSSCALHTAVQLDLFSSLANGPKNEKDLAQELACNERAFSMLITALASLGFLERNENHVLATDEALKFLSGQSPEYLGFIIRHHAHIMEGWVKLTEAVRTGRATAPARSSHTEEEKKREAFLMGMFNVARFQAKRIAEALDLSEKKKLVDIGGGPGTYAIYFCLENPSLHATVFDLPTTQPFAQKIIQQYALSDRIGFMAGNFLQEALPEGQDVAWLSQVLHGENPENTAGLIRNAVSCLDSGGLLCIQEFMLDDHRKGPEFAALFSLNMLVQTNGGQAYTQGEIAQMCMEAGVENIRILDVELPNSCRVMVGEKS